ncbi:hypothetical protein CW713_08745 [Methanophagales archaeon]|nr:MAG: hypothetical protein CW713_08745 [Methanophagales archaeon]
MISKKDMLVLGLVAIGGIGVASSIATSEGGVTGGGGFRIKPFGGIVGSNKAAEDTGDNAGTATIVLPPEPSVTFPAAPQYQAPMYYAPPPMPSQETKNGGGEVTETKKAYAAGLQKAVTPTPSGTAAPTSKMEAVGMMSGLGLSLAGVTPKISRSSKYSAAKKGLSVFHQRRNILRHMGFGG